MREDHSWCECAAQSPSRVSVQRKLFNCSGGFKRSLWMLRANEILYLKYETTRDISSSFSFLHYMLFQTSYKVQSFCIFCRESIDTSVSVVAVSRTFLAVKSEKD